MTEQTWTVVEGESPLVALAIHQGHAVRKELEDLYAIDERQRLREEDPFTGEWTTVTDTRVVVHRSRFEVDLNRPRDRAVYLRPEDAWGLTVWKAPPSPEIVARSLSFYDTFYAELEPLLKRKVENHGRFVVFDLHSYNHRRSGPDAPEAPPAENPEVNVGIGARERTMWSAVVESFVGDLRRFDFPGKNLDVRENVKFQGGHLSKWIHENFPGCGCALAIEFKKFFMDEWTGETSAEFLGAIRRALESTVSNILRVLANMAPPTSSCNRVNK